MPDLPPKDAMPQLSQARAVLEEHLGTTLLAIHLFGSAVDGGLRPFSDLDLLVTVDRPPAEDTRRALMTQLLAASAPPGASAALRPLEVTVLAHSQVVPWRYPPRRELQFGEWLRDDLRAGVFEPPLPDHDLALLLTKARDRSVNLLGPRAADLFDPVPWTDIVRSLLDTVVQWNEPPDWAGDERNIVLALARCWYTACTGRIASKEHAVAWVLEREHGPHRVLLAKARAAYLGAEPDDLASHPAAVADFVAHARRAIESRLRG
jgi:streptomycin 3"-adenylyltransferase